MTPSPRAALLLTAICAATVPAFAASAPAAAGAAATRAADAAPARASARAPAAAPAMAASTSPKAAAAVVSAAAPGQADIPLTEAQLDLSNQVLLGEVDCDLRQRVSLWPILTRPGHFELRFGKAVYTLVPHETTTGAVRLEDAAAGVVWLQIPAKSMLLDARRGQRLVDGCMHTAQRHEQADTASAPPAAAGLGITELQR